MAMAQYKVLHLELYRLMDYFIDLVLASMIRLFESNHSGYGGPIGCFGNHSILFACRSDILMDCRHICQGFVEIFHEEGVDFSAHDGLIMREQVEVQDRKSR